MAAEEPEYGQAHRNKRPHWQFGAPPADADAGRYRPGVHGPFDSGSEAEDSDFDGYSSEEEDGVRARIAAKGADPAKLGASHPAAVSDEDLDDANGVNRRLGKSRGPARMSGAARGGSLNDNDVASIGPRQRRVRKGAGADPRAVGAGGAVVVDDLSGASSTNRRRVAAGKGVDRVSASFNVDGYDEAKQRLADSKRSKALDDNSRAKIPRKTKVKKLKTTFGPNDFSAGERSDGSVD